MPDEKILLADLEAIEAVGYVVGYGAPDASGKPLMMLGTPPLVGKTMFGSDGRRYEGIKRIEPFDPRNKPEHAEFVPFALYSQRRVAIGVGDTEKKERFERALDLWHGRKNIEPSPVKRKSGASMSM